MAIYEAPMKLVEAYNKLKEEERKKKEFEQWLLSFAIAYFIQHNGAEIINAMGGIAGTIASFLGLKVVN